MLCARRSGVSGSGFLGNGVLGEERSVFRFVEGGFSEAMQLSLILTHTVILKLRAISMPYA